MFKVFWTCIPYVQMSQPTRNIVTALLEQKIPKSAKKYGEVASKQTMQVLAYFKGDSHRMFHFRLQLPHSLSMFSMISKVSFSLHKMSRWSKLPTLAQMYASRCSCSSSLHLSLSSSCFLNPSAASHARRSLPNRARSSCVTSLAILHRLGTGV